VPNCAPHGFCRGYHRVFESHLRLEVAHLIDPDTRRSVRDLFYSFFEPPPKAASLPDILGILRLSHKYDVVYLRRRALQHLETVYTSSLDAYDAVSTKATFSATGKDHISVARAALQADASCIVPCAVYRACSAGLDFIFDMESDETTIDSVQKRCLAVLLQQQRAFFDRPPYYVCLPSLASTCAKRRKCTKTADVILQVIVKRWEVGKLVTTIPDPLGRWKTQMSEQLHRCPACSEATIARLTEYRLSWWASMPSKFGLPDWPELLRLRAAAFDS
jgi:hypothetical protein